jgi:hypothetical protein
VSGEGDALTRSFARYLLPEHHSWSYQVLTIFLGIQSHAASDERENSPAVHEPRPAGLIMANLDPFFS